MSEHSKNNDLILHDEVEQDVVVLIKKMQQQLDSLEKKIDTLINQPQARPFSRENSFSKTSRPYSPSYNRSDREYSSFSRGKSFGRERPFEKSRSEESRGFGYKKKVYGAPQESSFGPGHSFKKRPTGERKPFGREKPFAYKPKERR